MVEPCPFEVLGIKDFDAPSSAIESAFRKRSLHCHPDKRPGDPSAKAHFEALAAAKEALLDPVRRAAAQSAASTSFKAKGPFTRFAQCRAAVRRKTGAKPSKPASKPASKPTEAAHVPPPRQEEKPARPGVDPEKFAAGIFFRHLEREREKKEGPREYLLPRTRFSRAAEEPPPLRKGPETRHVLKRARHSGITDGAGVHAKVRNISEMNQSQSSTPAWVGGDVRRALPRRTHQTLDGGERPETEGFAFERQHVPKRLVVDLEEESEEANGKDARDSKESKGPGSTDCPPLPLLLPWTADRLMLVAAIAEVTGAKKSDARILARVVEILRKKGGQVPLAALTRNPPRLQSILQHHARLLEVYLPGKYLAGTALQVHVRLRGAELQRATERFKQSRAAQVKAKAKAAEICGAKVKNSSSAGMAAPRRTKAVRMKVARADRCWQQPPQTVDVDSSDESCCVPDPSTRKRPPTSFVGGAKKWQAGTGREACGGQAAPVKEQEELGATPAPSDNSGSQFQSAGGQDKDRLLHRAYAHAVGRWQASRPGQGQLRYFLLLPAGNLGALRPHHPAILFSFDPASKVLYEFVPGQGESEGRCVVMWSPSCPEVNALLWTVLPLPPEQCSQAAPSTPPHEDVEEGDEDKEAGSSQEDESKKDPSDPMELIDTLIRDAAAEAGVILPDDS